MFDKARQSGAVDGRPEDLNPGSGPSAAFKGSGRTLAGIGDGDVAAAAAPAAPKKNRVISFYRNGIFTVDDGPARRMDDPANMRFIESIGRGECPEELEAEARGADVTVNLVKKDEDYQEPEKPKYNAFQGQGRTLDGGGGAGASIAAAAATFGAASEGEWEGADASKPTTSIQIRLADGSRMVAKFNHTQTISDIRRFIRASRPEATGAYMLMTSFPSAQIEDEGRTIEEAGLLNAVIIQKKV